MKIGIYPGTFDPVTNGHLDILRRVSKMFDKIVVGVAVDSDKNTLFNIDERVEFMKDAVKDISNIEVEAFSGLLMHFTESKGAKIIIRGLRAVSDFEYEFQLALMVKKLVNIAN